jgi:hypothetical protein
MQGRSLKADDIEVQDLISLAASGPKLWKSTLNIGSNQPLHGSSTLH